MKKIFTKKVKTLAIVSFMSISLLFMQSCEKQFVEENDIIIESNDVDFIVKDGYLVFSSIDAFLRSTSGLANLTIKEREEWEESIGFLSQRRIVTNIIQAEEEIDKINEVKFKGKKLNEINKKELFSDEYNKYLAKEVIKVIDEGTEDEYWDYAVYNTSFIEFINDDGLYAIKDTLYQVTKDGMKALKNRDFSKVDMLKKAVKTDVNNGIYIIESLENTKTYPGCIGKQWSNWKTESDKRIRVGVQLDVKYYIASDPSYYFYHDMYVQCQEKNFWGNWKYKLAETWIDGTWEIKVFKYSQHYSNSYSYHGTLNDYKSSINPQTGETVGYQGVFKIVAEMPDPFHYDDLYPPQFVSGNYTAIRIGGAHGIRATLTF
ncbi:MAG: hypothetical protein A2W99_06675 [Bacteroidetes bacterium GWF2_33_16]|nr:MAG: hypothetical protein A2X00_12110 [Bacteroidetes bacterium GWE2_32_14]OFY04379.1 MAG: hypothetical protein A2W99_06675 [Bacteroidetes bacterium GWF2_33_16]